MQSSIAQCVSFILYGNQFLQENSEFDFQASHSLQYCEAIEFCEWDKTRAQAKLPLIAANLKDWFLYLKKNNFLGLRLHHERHTLAHFNDRMTVGMIGGGGDWIIEAYGKSKSDFWIPSWQVGDRNHPEQKIWKVFYIQKAKGLTSLPLPKVDLNTLQADLHNILKQIAHFAFDQKQNDFGHCFMKALEFLEESPIPKKSEFPLAPPFFLDPSSEKLLNALQAAWVFGGMGSWNDLVFEGELLEKYTQLSDHLFYLIIEILIQICAQSGREVVLKKPSLLQKIFYR